VRERVAEKFVQEVVGSLKIRRESLGWSQRTLASKAGVDPKTVSLIERGIRSPTLFTLALLASALSQPLWKTMKDVEIRKEDEE
jgi:transcriptional regulator with XRE-family HTH domain